MMKQKLPLGIVDFRELRTPDEDGNSYVYVDKTAQIHQLVKGSKFNFLARPRRYGKSLLHSVLYHLFNGDRELFEGLWIAEEGRWDWNLKRPVIRIDFNEIGKQNPDDPNGTSLADALMRYINRHAQEAHGIELTSPTPGEKLGELIRALHTQTGQGVVLLVDEYDKPIVNFLEGHRREQAELNREALRSFYSVLKANQTPLHFVLLTGVSKFGKLSIFSDLSNLEDITLDEPFAAMLGYTRPEIEHYFAPFLENWAMAKGITMTVLWEHLTQWYNGYSWNGKDFMYTPWSVLNALKKKVIRSYWSLSGTPKMLVDLLREKQVPLPSLEGQWVSGELQDRTSLEAIDPLALFWQTGYLTIKGVKDDGLRQRYRLQLPNREVRESFLMQYLEDIASIDANQSEQLAYTLNDALADGQFHTFFEQVNLLLAKIPYQLYPNQPQEKHYHIIVYLAMMLSGHNAHSEVAMAGGRIDTVLETADAFYVFEFKVSATVQEALQQIEDRGYANAYINQGKKVIALGVAFDADTRSVAEWKEEVVFTP